MSELIIGLWEWVASVMDSIMAILPNSPFRDVPASIASSQLVGWLNWCFPVGGIVQLFTAWVAAIGAIYAFGFVLRGLHVIQG